jgi:hypothetical protein
MRVVSRSAPVLLAVGVALAGCTPPSQPGSGLAPAMSPATAADTPVANQVVLGVADMT